MKVVIFTAVGVGGATVFGALLGFLFKKTSHKFGDIVLSFAAGVMMCAAICGLILPSLETEGNFKFLITVAGIFCGALILNLIDRIVPHLHRIAENDYEKHPSYADKVSKILLFVLAIAIHNFPEGIAAGVGFGTGNDADALTIAGGIALQNIPEGMVIIAPMLSVGISKGKALLIASLTGVIEVIGTFMGYFFVSLSTAILPFALSFAGGTMLYIISDEMIPETHSHGNERAATYALLFGFCFMLGIDLILA